MRARAQTGVWDWTVSSVRGSTTDGPVGGSHGVLVVDGCGCGSGGRGCGRGVIRPPGGTGTSLGVDGRYCLERNGSCDGGGGCIVTATVTESVCDEDDDDGNLNYP